MYKTNAPKSVEPLRHDLAYCGMVKNSLLKGGGCLIRHWFWGQVPHSVMANRRRHSWSRGSRLRCILEKIFELSHNYSHPHFSPHVAFIFRHDSGSHTYCAPQLQHSKQTSTLLELVAVDNEMYVATDCQRLHFLAFSIQLHIYNEKKETKWYV